MYIARFSIENYKSFRETGQISLTPGFNVVVGQNNVGKTALLEALGLALGNKPHRSLTSLPTPTAPLRGESVADVSFGFGRNDLIGLLRRYLPVCWVPTPEGRTPDQSLDAFKRAIQTELSVLRCTSQGGAITSAALESFGSYPNMTANSAVRILDADGNVELAAPGVSTIGVGDRFDYQLANIVKSQIYTFRAERFNVGQQRFGPSTLLRPDAGNLPEVLNVLQGKNPERFSRLNRLIQIVFPSIQRVTVRPLQNDVLEIVVWSIDPATEREDLAVPLTESGTGIGQVLAMLYVVITAEWPQVFLIDEPQSFLHPGAVRKLIDILKQSSQHQFIITTHSPTALIAAEPGTLLRLRTEQGETIIDRLDVREASDLRLVLADVGARLSDVFGADGILWVEGRTEELCFPEIARRLVNRPLLGTAIVGVLHTADFDARRSEATVELYSRLSTGRGLLPPAVGFIFDREGRTEHDRDDLERRGNVLFLQRRMYENYLLNPDALALVMTGTQGFRDEPLSEGEVRRWLELNRWNPRHFDRLPAERTDEVWLREVRGDRLLGALFGQLSDQRVQYDKVRHGVALTDWLLENSPGDLREVAELIARALTPRPA